MELIDYIAIYHRGYFKIIDGPHVGKFCQINYIIFDFQMVITKSGTELPAKVLRPVLIPLDQTNQWLSLEEAVLQGVDFFNLIEKRMAVKPENK